MVVVVVLLVEVQSADVRCVLGRLSQGTFEFDSAAISTRHDAIDEMRNGLDHELRQLRPEMLG